MARGQGREKISRRLGVDLGLKALRAARGNAGAAGAGAAGCCAATPSEDEAIPKAQAARVTKNNFLLMTTTILSIPRLFFGLFRQDLIL